MLFSMSMVCFSVNKQIIPWIIRLLKCFRNNFQIIIPQILKVFLYFPTDTETLAITQKILDKYCPGTKYTWDVKVTVMGLQREEVAKKIVKLYKLPLTWQQYADEAQREAMIYMRNCRIMPGNEIRLSALIFLMQFCRRRTIDQTSAHAQHPNLHRNFKLQRII